MAPFNHTITQPTCPDPTIGPPGQTMPEIYPNPPYFMNLPSAFVDPGPPPVLRPHNPTPANVLALANGATKIALTGPRNWATAGDWNPSGVPAASDRVLIPSGCTMSMNAVSADVAHVYVASGGELKWADAVSIFKFQQIVVFTGGKLTIGGDSDGNTPLTQNVTLVIKTVDNSLVGRDQEGDWDVNAHGIWGWGRVSIVGTPKTHFRFLAANVGTPPYTPPGSPVGTITVDMAPTGWVDGDKLVVTDGGPPVMGDTEIVRRVESDDRELVYRFIETYPLC